MSFPQLEWVNRPRAAAVAGCCFVVLMLGACAGEQTPPRPTAPDRLAACPSAPNCVSSLASDADHHVAPLAYRGDPAAAMRRLRTAIAAMPRATVVAASDRALRAEFRSRLLRFVDDVDCVADPAASVIQIRSASRVGYSDLGANRQRVEAIRSAFETTPR